MSERRARGWLRLVFGLLVLVVVAFLAYGIEWGRRWLVADGRFPVTEIRVSGNDLLYEGEVLDMTGVRRGVNILAVDTEMVRARLLASGWIRDAVVRRRPPGRLLIDVDERRPWLLVPGEPARFADREGKVFPSLGKEERLDLPLLVDRSGAPGRVLAELAAAFAPDERFFAEKIVEVGIDAAGSVTLVEGSRGTRVRLGSEGFAVRASRLQAVLDEWVKSGEAYEEIDLRFEGQAVARRPIASPDEEDGKEEKAKEEGSAAASAAGGSPRGASFDKKGLPDRASRA
jgi:cell division protein FtsQ